MRFWDSSALVPLCVDESSSTEMRALLREDAELAVWWGTSVECLAALARHERSGNLTPSDASLALAALAELSGTWLECPPTDPLRDVARRVVRIHDVRTADAFQLAAAETVSERRPESLPFVTLDTRLATAARREGYPVLPFSSSRLPSA